MDSAIIIDNVPAVNVLEFTIAEPIQQLQVLMNMVANNIDTQDLATVDQFWELRFPPHWVMPEYVPHPTFAATRVPESGSGEGI